MATVMIVDDEAISRETLARLLRREGYGTVTATDGSDALRKINEAPPDMILLDVNMPGMDGLELLEMLHHHPQWKALPVVMLTAMSDTHTVHRAEQLGAKHYLVKAAFSIHEMMGHVRRYTKHDVS